jgi:hypothetical protein
MVFRLLKTLAMYMTVQLPANTQDSTIKHTRRTDRQNRYSRTRLHQLAWLEKREEDSDDVLVKAAHERVTAE